MSRTSHGADAAASRKPPSMDHDTRGGTEMSERATTTRAEIGVIGGSGFYQLLTDTEQVRIDTPYGKPSDAVSVGTIAGRRVAFIPRHGRDHRIPPHKINYRANLWALRSLGVRQILAPCAVGALRRDLPPQGLSSCRTNWWTVPASVCRRSTT